MINHVPDDVYKWMLQRWKTIMVPMELGRVDFQMDDSEAQTSADFRYVGPANQLTDANGMSSKVLGANNQPRMKTVFKNWRDRSGGVERQVAHMPILDIDFEVAVIPSSTPGHWHLAFPGIVMGEAQFMDFLADMAKHGIIQQGYWGASARRKAAWLRTPWAPKGSKLHEEVAEEAKANDPHTR